MPRNLRLRPETPPAVALKLADPQQYILNEFANEGLTIAVVAGTLLDAMKDPESTERVAAARLFFDVTFGRAASTVNSKNLHLHAKTDQFFEEEKFSKTPPPKV